jgi:hypothetical protein
MVVVHGFLVDKKNPHDACLRHADGLKSEPPSLPWGLGGRVGQLLPRLCTPGCGVIVLLFSQLRDLITISLFHGATVGSGVGGRVPCAICREVVRS